jgi:hypothetical protein
MGTLNGAEEGMTAVAPPVGPPVVGLHYRGMVRVMLTTEEDGRPSVHLVMERPEGGGPDGSKGGPDECEGDGEG